MLCLEYMALGEVLNLVIGHVYILQGKKRLQATDVRDFWVRISSYEIELRKMT